MKYGRCWLCGRYGLMEEHHIFSGANRKLSEKYGLKVMMSVEKMREKAHDSVEPKNRVLTFDEVATFADLPEMTLMWVEVKFTKESDIFQEIPIGFNGELMQFLEVNSASLYTHKQNYPPEDYGSRWRCWLEKPTVKEMEMALWEE